MKKKISIICIILIVLIAIGFIVYGCINSWEIYHNEFNAQIEIHGFYKEDVKVLWQRPKEILTAFMFIGGFLFLLGDSIFLIICILNDWWDNDYQEHNYGGII